MALQQIGYVAIRRNPPRYRWEKKFAGFNARCKVYASRGVALAALRCLYPYGADPTEEKILQDWNITPAFIEVPETENVQ